jgi:cytochrome c oxidase subunit 3
MNTVVSYLLISFLYHRISRFHVLSGVIINIIIFFNVLVGTYEKERKLRNGRKVGLYWHFVDLVWVFVFTVFYLV